MTIRIPVSTPLVLLCVGALMLAHPYQGIFHDANLYTLQALVRLHPDSLSHDVFLLFGSQDRFTYFSPIYALGIHFFGLEHAAALLTIISQTLLIFAGWGLAQRVMTADQALLGTAVLIAVPGYYGPEHVFSYLEPFLTPRMGAEALTVLAIVAVLCDRKLLSALLMIVAIGIHPVIAAAGLVMLFMSFVVLSRPGIAALAAALAVVCLLIAACVLQPGELGGMNSHWTALVQQRSPYLFLSHWNLDDWGRASVVLTTLIVGSGRLEHSANRLCFCAALTMAAGLALTWFGCDFLHLTLLTQMQPWRWEWIAAFTAALTLPYALTTAWMRGIAGRTTSVLLVAGWIFGTGTFALITCLTAVLTLGLNRLRSRELHLIFGGGCAVLALSLAWRIATNLEFAEMHFVEASMPLWLRRCVSFAHDGLASTLIIVTVASIVNTTRTSISSVLLSALAVCAIVALLPANWDLWSREDYSKRSIASFAPWRQIISPGSEVFWAESPLSSWALLNRPNYISALQTSGMVFSNKSALELEHRARSLASAINPATFLDWSSSGAHLSVPPETLIQICKLGVFPYLVTSADIGSVPVAVQDRLKLYACTPQARAAAAAT